MSEHEESLGQPWRRPMVRRRTDETHRQASFLELFFDLCFVVAVASAAAHLHHALAEGHIATGVVSYALVFFAIWWAWMGFTWFASAYDVDDLPYRVAAFVQIIGTLVLAAGVGRAFDEADFSLIFFGYLIMRCGLISQRLRAARSDADGRTTMLRYVVGEAGVMPGWAIVVFALPDDLVVPGFVVMAAAELVVPLLAERALPTPWHRHHIAERYGLFTIIVLGESVLAATVAVRSALDADAAWSDLFEIIIGGLLIMFAMWFVYFAKPAHRFLNSSRIAFLWGYGHYVILASGAAIGAGLALGVDHATHHSELGDVAAGGAITIPVALFVGIVWLLQVRPQRVGVLPGVLYLGAAVAVLGTTFTPWPQLATGIVLTALAGISVGLSHRDYHRVVNTQSVAGSAR